MIWQMSVLQRHISTELIVEHALSSTDPSIIMSDAKPHAYSTTPLVVVLVHLSGAGLPVQEDTTAESPIP